MDASSNKGVKESSVGVQGHVLQVRIVFMGTPQFSATVLQSLIDHQYHIVGVITQPDKPVGRQQEYKPSQTKTVALRYGIPIFQPEKMDDETVSALKNWDPDLIIVAAYGRILPERILAIPRYGCVNVHASLLPKWRGASPIQNALLAGETETGVTLMLMDKGMDTGDIIATEKTPIDPDETRTNLEARLAVLGSELLAHTIPQLLKHTHALTFTKQDEAQVTLCQLIDREDGRIFWNDDSQSIYNRYRALSPWPGIFTLWKNGKTSLRLKLLSVAHLKKPPITKHLTGEVFEIGESIGVQTGTGVLLLEVVQLEGKEKTDIKTFINGYRKFIGSILQ